MAKHERMFEHSTVQLPFGYWRVSTSIWLAGKAMSNYSTERRASFACASATIVFASHPKAITSVFIGSGIDERHIAIKGWLSLNGNGMARLLNTSRAGKQRRQQDCPRYQMTAESDILTT